MKTITRKEAIRILNTDEIKFKNIQNVFGLYPIARNQYKADEVQAIKNNSFPIIYPKMRTTGNGFCKRCRSKGVRLFEGNKCYSCTLKQF